MTMTFLSIPERGGVTPEIFRDDIVAAYHPVVLRGFAADWPAVAAGLDTPEVMAGYLKGFDRGAPVQAFVGPPEIRGRFFYAPQGRAVNFTRRPTRMSAAIDEILAGAGRDDAPSIYVGSAPAAQVLPGFETANRNPLLAPDIEARVWVGGETSIQTHYDLSDNIAVVVAGRRRFTLFPPEQTANLYVGPLDFTPAGQPVSLVSLDDPDLTLHPRFADALPHGMSAELEPGDAIYIPTLWWHHVRSTGPLNVLVNFWWSDLAGLAGSPFEVLIHALMSLRHLPEPQRRAWRAIFDHYVFEGDTAGDHLPADMRGVLGPLSPQLARNVRAFLLHGLGKGG